MYQSMEQIREQHTSDWVFMVNCTEGQYGSVSGGEVVLHSENRDVVIRGMGNYTSEPGLTYFGYVGVIPEGTSVIL